MSDQYSKYSVNCNARQRHVESYHIWEAGTCKSLEFMGEKWLKWLIDYKSSCCLIVFCLTTWPID